MSVKSVLYPSLLFITIAFLSVNSADVQKSSIFKPEVFESHVRFLSHDLLEGRGIGTRGSALAQLYIETLFRSYGLEPVKKGDFKQTYKMLRFTPDQNAEMIIDSKGSKIGLKFGDDFICTNFGIKENSFKGKPIFIGYGIHSAADGWDFYRNVNVKGRLLIGFTNEPGRENPSVFKGKELTWFGRWVYKYDEAARQGAAGLIIIHNDDDAGYSWEVVRNSWSGDTFKLADDKNILPLQMWMTEAKAKELLAKTGYSLEDLRKKAEQKAFKAVELPVDITVNSRLSKSETDGVNIVGIKRGSDPKLKDKAIVLTAHYDHFGIGRDYDGDSIYNGALDNCTALSLLLALAEAYGKETLDNKMTLVFAAVDAEEEGMLGSTFLALNPPVPPANVAANINFEMNNPWGETSDITAIGAEKSELINLVGKTAERLKMTLTPDQVPEQGFFYRSDQLSFARAGIPALWLNSGFKYIDKPADFGMKMYQKYRMEYYHKPSDEITPEFYYSGLVQIAEFAEILINEIQSAGDIKWKESSDFQRK
jgi:Zn-dependent M28 family amino/carboxypeptidase